MKWIRIASILIFAAAILIFGTSFVVTVMGRDLEGPSIFMEQTDIMVSIQDSEEALLEGISAFDSKDGDVTASLVVESLSNFIGENERQAVVVAFDSDAHVSKAVRTIHYTDYTSPHFSLSSPLRFPVGITSGKLTAYLKAVDCLDGDLTRWIQQYNVEGSRLNTDAPGFYQIVFSVSNSAGDVEKFQATVEIYDTTTDSVAPKMSLSNYLIYLEKGASFDPTDYLEAVMMENVIYRRNEEGILECEADRKLLENGNMETEIRVFPEDGIKIDNPVNVNELGWYEVAYHIEDSMGNGKTLYMLVCVQEGR